MIGDKHGSLPRVQKAIRYAWTEIMSISSSSATAGTTVPAVRHVVGPHACIAILRLKAFHNALETHNDKPTR